MYKRYTCFPSKLPVIGLWYRSDRENGHISQTKQVEYQSIKKESVILWQRNTVLTYFNKQLFVKWFQYIPCRAIRSIFSVLYQSFNAQRTRLPSLSVKKGKKVSITPISSTKNNTILGNSCAISNRLKRSNWSSNTFLPDHFSRFLFRKEKSNF